jgi:D-arabinose 1-dehydrogenase-like Zn-dependent alcohol dehydrogenase
VTVPPLFLAPAAFDVDPAAAVALLAAAGQTYQAQASAGMAPGDAVVVFGPMGPGAFPLQVLAAAGLRVTWVSPAQESPIELPDRVEHRRTWSLDDDLPSARCHLLDLEPTPASIEQWLPLARLCVSCTLVGRLPSTAHAPLHRLLDGEVALRWVHDLHPHLVLDVLSLIVTGRVSVQPHLQPMSFDDFAAADFRRAETGRWPVLVP